MLPDTIEVCSLELVEDINPVVTIVDNNLTPGLFSSQDPSFSCHKSAITPTQKVNKQIKECY